LNINFVHPSIFTANDNLKHSKHTDLEDSDMAASGKTGEKEFYRKRIKAPLAQSVRLAML